MSEIKCYHMTLLRKGKDAGWVCNGCGATFDLVMTQKEVVGPFVFNCVVCGIEITRYSMNENTRQTCMKCEGKRCLICGKYESPCFHPLELK